MFEKIIFKIKKIKWRKDNRHNYTEIGKNFSMSRVKVGNYTYGTLNVTIFNSGKEKLTIGNYCSIADDVKFLLGGEHNYETVSTYPFKTKILNEISESICKGDIVVEDDVWIGTGAIILSGVTIGQGAIIGAGTVVAKDIPPYAIYANGRIIKYRFSDNIIEKLKQIDYSKLNQRRIIQNIQELYKDITESNVEDIVKKINGDINE